MLAFLLGFIVGIVLAGGIYFWVQITTRSKETTRRKKED